MLRLKRSAFLLAITLAMASSAAPGMSRAEAGRLPVGACVISGNGSRGVVAGHVPGGYTFRSSLTGLTWVESHATAKATPCPSSGSATGGAASLQAAPGRSPARVAPLQPTRSTPPAAGATLGKYHCVLFIPGSGLVTQSGFTLLGGGRYTHELGGGGTTRVSGDLIEFSGGPLTGQAGKVSAGRVNLFNAARSRTVIDCDTRG
jgi:hypothetical protein